MAGRQSVLNYLPGLFSGLAFGLILLILLPGVNHALLGLYYLKTDTSNLNVPSRLSNSTFLRDLSTVSGADYVGKDATTSSLELGEVYTVYLLTSCARTGRSVDCAQARVGFKFDATSDLKLDSTALQGTYDNKYLDALSAYSKLSGFISGAYVLSCALVILTPFIILFTVRFPRAGLLAAASSVISALFLLAANTAAMVTFKNVDSTFNAAFNSAGLSSSLGTKIFALSWVAFAASLFAAIVYVIRACSPDAATRRRHMVARSMGDKPGASAVITVGGPVRVGDDAAGTVEGATGQKKPGFIDRIPTWNRHKYVQVEKQPALVRTDAAGRERAVVVESPDDVRRRSEDDWAAADEYANPGGRGIAMKSLAGGNKPRRDMNMAYEPYNSAS
ncbi:hypothetical protein NKR23_g6905 [Pleurostoma richardsiae]|uniref:Uncharacterized protein n=1 Tax=Pleurostoma richardsiae TaxID=41990 RepID=A0AA38RPW9_9PEZI|nr:hypothetical protein NKR23_g6905 [Pleurostoma richardsiae]